jgi:hypothetical protein
MDRTKILAIVKVFLKIGLLINLISLPGLLFITIHSAYSPKTYEKLMVKEENNTYNLWYSSTIPAGQSYDDWQKLNSAGNKLYYFTKLDLRTRIRISFMMALNIVLCMLIIKEIINFFDGLKNIKTFFNRSSLYFHRISIYLIVFFVIMVFISTFPIEFKMTFSDGISGNLNIAEKVKTISTKSYSFYVDYKLFIYLAMSLILSLAFKEAERLRIENELTI